MSDFIDPDIEEESLIGEIDDRHLYKGDTINGCYERIEDPKAEPPVQPEIQLKEGWRTGNIKVGTSPPSSDTGHTWDLYIEAPDGVGWVEATKVYIKRPL